MVILNESCCELGIRQVGFRLAVTCRIGFAMGHIPSPSGSMCALARRTWKRFSSQHTSAEVHVIGELVWRHSFAVSWKRPRHAIDALSFST